MGRQRSVKYKDNTYTFSGDLGDALKKAQRDIESAERNLDYYRWNYEKAKKEYDSRMNKIEVNKGFIDCIKFQEPDWFDENGEYIPGSYEKKYNKSETKEEEES